MDRDNIFLEESWKFRLADEFSKDYMVGLKVFLKTEIAAGKKIHPPPREFFSAFEATPFEKVRVVILGQDPYHGANEAHGLSFSVKPGVRIPPSLRNIFLELEADMGVKAPSNGFLLPWAHEGVFLLNAILSVVEDHPLSHQGRGWEIFTDKVIEVLSREREGLVFILWGRYAKEKGRSIDRRKHFVIESPHPSPLSAHRGFFGSRPFSKANRYFESRQLPKLSWNFLH